MAKNIMTLFAVVPTYFTGNYADKTYAEMLLIFEQFGAYWQYRSMEACDISLVDYMECELDDKHSRMFPESDDFKDREEDELSCQDMPEWAHYTKKDEQDDRNYIRARFDEFFETAVR